VPVPFLQSPEQQPLLSLQTSPVWMQKDAPSLQMPSWQRVEQHCVLSVHGLPEVRQTVLSGWHTPPVQLPPQHSLELAHAARSARQALALQRPPVQAREQHSVDVVQAPPVSVHLLMEDTQVLVAGSHRPEQQSCPVAQVWLNGRQSTEGAVSPPSGKAASGPAT
jgi:hypothetical protein